MAEGIIGAMKRAAEEVSIRYVEGNKAHAELRDAKVKLLDEVVAVIGPARRAIVSVVKSDWTETLHGTDEARVVENWFDWRGLHVMGPGVCRDGIPGQPYGEQSGKSLYLREDGTWAVVEYVGCWTHSVGGSCWWAATDGTQAQAKAHLADVSGEVSPTWAVLTTREVVAQGYVVEVIVENISAALEAQLSGNAAKRTKAAIARAAKIRAVTELLK